MRKFVTLTLLSLSALVATGCATPQELRSKWKFGPEYRSGNHMSHTRHTVQTGLECKWSNGWTTGVTYRGRYNDGANGFDRQDQGVWFEFSFPLWKAEKPDRVKTLESRLRVLESRLENDNDPRN